MRLKCKCGHLALHHSWAPEDDTRGPCSLCDCKKLQETNGGWSELSLYELIEVKEEVPEGWRYAREGKLLDEIIRLRTIIASTPLIEVRYPSHLEALRWMGVEVELGKYRLIREKTDDDQL